MDSGVKWSARLLLQILVAGFMPMVKLIEEGNRSWPDHVVFKDHAISRSIWFQTLPPHCIVAFGRDFAKMDKDYCVLC
jgi:hypothetical protein